MACEFICDGCGKRAAGETNGHQWFKPSLWFERTEWNDPDDEIGARGGKILSACSRECVGRVNAKQKAAGGKSMPVLPW